MSDEEKDAQCKSTWRRLILDFKREERDQTKVHSSKVKESYSKLMIMYKERYGEVETTEYKQESSRAEEEREKKALIQRQRSIPNPSPDDTKGWFEKIKQVGPLEKWEKISQSAYGTYSEYADARHKYNRVKYEYDNSRVDWYHNNFGWAVPNEPAIQAIANFVGDETLLEVGAGYGLWGMLLRSIQCKVVITDKMVYKHQYTAIEMEDGLTAVSKHPECTVLMTIWPHPADHWIDETLSAFTGNKFILVGEFMTDMGMGCTDIPRDLINWKLVATVPHPNFSTFSEVQMYTRK